MCRTSRFLECYSRTSPLC
ncbi:hypothetical protein GBAR_LOCUS18992 [Geodia barretti]|uniref:Uncharacterized protein n=1 Tax=Geodia barretti TaxID=519541 RepID=A0AA35SQD2_GEOBA|nr:hypothetical protein GBAR_LOCUS18992 [Geodia barretti]